MLRLPTLNVYEGCPESIQPFWISREPVAWPWCNLAGSQWRPYCASVNSHSPVGLVSRQWDAVDLSLYTVWLSHSQWPSEQISESASMRLPILQLSCRLFWQSITSPRSVTPLQPRLETLRLLAFPKVKIAFEREEICECDGHTVHKLSQRRLTADWLAPRESDFSQMRSKVSSDWLPSYIQATRPAIEIFKMAGHFPDSLRNSTQ